MKRLTKRDEYGNADIIGVETQTMVGDLLLGEFNKVTEALNRLAEYEDLEEQGLLVRLPFKVGDTIYYIDNEHIYESEVFEITATDKRFKSLGFYDIHGLWFLADTVFLTRADAEKKLKELKGE